MSGGGARNRELMRRLAMRLPERRVETTATRGIDPDWVEAIAFAWLAHRRLESAAGNLPSVTGFVQPELRLVTGPEGEVTDVEAVHCQDLADQMLRWGGRR